MGKSIKNKQEIFTPRLVEVKHYFGEEWRKKFEIEGEWQKKFAIGLDDEGRVIVLFNTKSFKEFRESDQVLSYILWREIKKEEENPLLQNMINLRDQLNKQIESFNG